MGQIPRELVQLSVTRGSHDFTHTQNLPDQSCPLAEFRACTLPNSRAKTHVKSVSYGARAPQPPMSLRNAGVPLQEAHWGQLLTTERQEVTFTEAFSLPLCLDRSSLALS